ncbi:MAG: hypothetical protein ACRD1S_03150 [Vicinamibacterales bacterium]
MSTIKRAVVKAYNPSTHKASVQISGSLAVWLDGLPVATDIPPAEVIAGRECAVLLFTEHNPDDGVVVTVHGAVPAGISGGSKVQDADGDTKVDVEQTPDEDRIRMTVAGVLRYLMQGANPEHGLTGGLSVGGNLRVSGTAITDLIDPVILGLFRRTGAGIDGLAGLVSDIGGTTALGSGSVIGVAGRALARDATTLFAHGLDYLAGAQAQNLTEANGVKCQIIFASAAGRTITSAASFLARNPINIGGTIVNLYGLRVEPLTSGNNRRPFQEEGTGAIGDAHGNRFRSNTQFGSLAGSFGGGDGVVGIADRTVAPVSNPVAGGVLYAEGGALKWRGSAGTVTTLAPA